VSGVPGPFVFLPCENETDEKMRFAVGGERVLRARECAVLLPGLATAEGHEEPETERQVAELHRRAEGRCAEDVEQVRGAGVGSLPSRRVGRVRGSERVLPRHSPERELPVEEDVRALAEADACRIVVEGRRVRGDHASLLPAEMGGGEPCRCRVAGPRQARHARGERASREAHGNAITASAHVALDDSALATNVALAGV
jgi:hypothetical protein